MARDPLEALVRLRRLAVDDARRALAECLRVEAAAEQAAAELADRIEQEADAAASLATSDAEVEAFAAWLRRIRPEQQAAHMAQDEAELATTRARALVTAARAAAQAAEEMLQRHAAAIHAEAERLAQRAIDEVAGRRHSDSRNAGGNDTDSRAE